MVAQNNYKLSLLTTENVLVTATFWQNPDIFVTHGHGFGITWLKFNIDDFKIMTIVQKNDHMQIGRHGSNP